MLVLKLPGEVPDEKTFLSFVQDELKNYKEFVRKIAYSFVKKANSENSVIPALMAENEVLFSGISPFISNIFNEEIIK